MSEAAEPSARASGEAQGEADGEADGEAGAARALTVGGRARIVGLEGRAELNGSEATLLQLDEGTGRWEVRLGSACGDVAGVRVRPQNLDPLPPEQLIAAEIGFSIGKVYTSLSGWSDRESGTGAGWTQLVLLGHWLQQRGYAFWSLGHCYSPAMDYKRQLGQRVYPRHDFLALLRRHRGTFSTLGAREADAGAPAGGAFDALRVGEACDSASLV